MADKPEFAGRSRRYLLRPIGAADDASIAAVLSWTYGEAHAAGAIQLLRPEAAARISVAYASERAAYFVLTDDGVVVGGGGFGPLPGARSEVCELRELCLLPQARGQGAATGLVEHCLAVALAFGYRHCYAELVHTMRPAVRLLERTQFSVLNQPVGQTGHYLCDRWYLRDL